MLKSEFEQLALRKPGAKIGFYLYCVIEQYYMDDSEYHRLHGGANEDKRSFVKRVFGGKVNTPRSIVRKLTKEAIAANRWDLQGTRVTEERLKEMDAILHEHYETLAKCG